MGGGTVHSLHCFVRKLIFIKKHFIFFIFLFFTVSLGWGIYQEIRGSQIYSNVDFEKGERKYASAGESLVLPVRLKTDSLLMLHIPFIFESSVSRDDFFINVNNNSGDDVIYITRIDKKSENTAFLVIKFQEPVEIDSITIVCRKNLTYLFDGGYVQSKQYGLQSKYRFLFCAGYSLLCLAAYILFLFIHRFVKNFALKYFIYAVLLGCICIGIWPAFNIPDERVHFDSANFYANVFLKIQPSGDFFQRRITLRKCDNNIYPDEISNSPKFTRDLQEFWEVKDYKRYYTYAFPKIWKTQDSQEYITIIGDICEPGRIIYYLPHIFGIMIGRALNMNQYVLYYFSCFLSLIFSVATISFAFSRTKIKSILFYFLALNPAFLQQMCHFTYDGLIYVFAFSFLLFFFNYCKNRNVLDLIFSIIFLLLLYPAKEHIYMGLGILYLALFKKQFKILYHNKKIFYSVLALAILIVSVFYVKYIVCNPSTYRIRSGLRDKTYLTFVYSRTYILLNPLDSIFRFIYTLFLNSWDYLGQAVGLILGARTLCSSFFVQVVFIFIAYFSTTDKSNCVLEKGCRVLPLLAIGLVSLLIFFGMFTEYGNAIAIGGVQGRYFIPILPLVFMILNSNKLQFGKNHNNSQDLLLAIPLYVLIVFIDIFALILR